MSGPQGSSAQVRMGRDWRTRLASGSMHQHPHRGDMAGNLPMWADDETEIHLKIEKQAVLS